MLRIMLTASTESAISVLVPAIPRVRKRPVIIRFIVPNGCSAEHLRSRIRSGAFATRAVIRSSASSWTCRVTDLRFAVVQRDFSSQPAQLREI